MRAAILARVSDAKQLVAGGDGGYHTLAGQGETLRRMADREGWPVVRVFEIPGESAYSDGLAARPMFVAVVEAAERREFDVLLVARLLAVRAVAAGGVRCPLPAAAGRCSAAR